MKLSKRSLCRGVSLAALLMCGMSAAQAQDAPASDADPVEVLPDATPLAQDDDGGEIVVTGTSIRGAGSVGSNVISVGREEIENTSAQTVQQILRSIPALTGSGSTPQGNSVGNSFYQPTIHSLGSSSSNSTLVLVDGHRISPGSQQQTLTDPNIIPPIALERVEVLAEGASSIYGSDAVAGVVNFITRRRYDGLMVTAQAGFGEDYRTYNAGVLWGTVWDRGSVMLAYNFSNRSSLAFADRINRDYRARGGTNFGTFFCAPATIQPQGVSGIYPSPTATAPVANNSANAPCQIVPEGDIFPEETRHNAMFKARYEVTPELTVGLDAVYSNLRNRQAVSRGTLTATVFRTGPQANPFYVNPPGVLPGTTAGDRQQVRWNADELLGPGAFSYNDAVNYYFAGDLEYRFGNDLRLTALALYGREDSMVGNEGQLCVSCANLALNGTTNAGGSLTQPSIPGTNVIVTSLPLTPSNALDVWNPAGSNRTSPAILALLTDNITRSNWYYSMKQARIGLDGPLVELPGGPLRFAIGAEYVGYALDINRTRPNNTGPSSRGSEFFDLFLSRNVKSAYAELLVPIIGPGNELPFVQRLSFNASIRHDRYSDTGSTTNPRFGATWEIVRGVRLRGNYSESFVAPQLTSYGDRSRGGLTSFSGYGASTGTLIVPIASFPLAAQLPGCNAPGQVTCTIGSSTPGISLNGAPADPQPGRGVSWSIGIDLEPTALPGFRLGATLFNNRLINQITGTSASNAINSAALNSNLQIFPNGATQADIDAVAGSFPQTSPLPATIYYILSVRQQNVLNLDIQGIDADVSYRFETQSAGTFTIGGSISYFTKFDQRIADSPTFSVLNTTGFNNTFPSIQTQARANLGWEMGGFQAVIYANYVGGYRNWSGSTVEPLVSENGNPVSGGDRVSSRTIFDLNLSYTLPEGGVLGGSQFFVDVTNVFDTPPAFYNSTNGYDGYGGNIIGRVVTLGVRAIF